MTGAQADWSGIVHGDFADLEKFRRRLDAGADPCGELWQYETPLHMAAQEGSPEVVFELASFASRGSAIVHCLVYAGLRPGSTDCLENPDAWLRLGPSVSG